ncbi:MAG: PEP-CTERM sorting domain-containing protein, partial [bacterium]|nr:PEP-CTERM sorting domain-containing protein [bacterium]
LGNYDVFVMGEPGSTPNAAELGELSSWVSGGGILLLLADSGNSGLPGLDNIASGLGISFDWGGGVSGNRTLLGGNFASEGLYDLVGQTLITTPGTGVTGGTVLAQNYLDYASLGLGWVFGFGDRLDHNFFINPIGHNVNGDLFLNIANGPVGNPNNSVPEPTTIWLLSLGLLAWLMFAPKKRAAVI